jgi:predicted dehydrogenase
MYRVGIVGLGIMGRRMADAMAAHPNFEVVCAFDPHWPANAPAVRRADSAAALIADPMLDCIYVASPPSSHLEAVEAAAAAGKAIFCEKPLASSVAEAQACLAAVRKAGIPAAVNFPLATVPAAKRLRDLVAEGSLGSVAEARLTLRFAQWPRPWQMGATAWLGGSQQGGFLREVGSHFLFLAHRMFGQGRLRESRIVRSPTGAETSVNAVVAYATATLTINGAVAGDADDFNRFEVIGSRSTAAVTDWYRLDHDGVVSDRMVPGPAQLDALSCLLAGAPDQPLATFEEAASVTEVVEAILAGSVDREPAA